MALISVILFHNRGRLDLNTSFPMMIFPSTFAHPELPFAKTKWRPILILLLAMLASGISGESIFCRQESGEGTIHY